MKTIPMHEIREFYTRNNPDGHWFEPGAMRFFGTKLPENGYELASGGVYFITRETAPSGKVGYAVRRQLPDGKIRNVSELCQYSTRSAARAAIKDIEVMGVAA